MILDLSIDIQCNLFERKTYISYYSCEIWRTQPQDLLELFYRKFIKTILHLRPSIPSCIVSGEFGRLQLQVTIDKHLMSFWQRLLNEKECSLAHIVYMIALQLFVRDVYKAKWLCRVKNIVLKQSMIDINQAKQLIYTRIK